NLAFLVAALACIHFTVHAVFWLLPSGTCPRPLIVANDLSIIGVMTVGRHLTRIVTYDGAASRRWIAGVYAIGLAVAVAVLVLGPSHEMWRLTVLQFYIVAAWAVMIRQGMRMAVRGGWRPGGAAFQIRGPDVLLMGASFAAVLGFLGFIFAGR